MTEASRRRRVACVVGWGVISGLALGLASPLVGATIAVVSGVAFAGIARMWRDDVDRWSREMASLAAGRTLSDDASASALATAAALQEAHTALDEAEAQATMAWAELDRVLDASPIGVVILGSDGRIRRANQSLKALLGVQRVAAGRLPVEAFPVPELIEALDEVRAVGVTEPRDCVRGERDLEVSAFASGDGTVGFVRDVSRERRVARARTDFVANVSHELRTPIAAILGYAEALVGTPDLDEAAVRMAHKVHRNGLRLRQLFEDLMALYKLEARRRQLPKERITLAPLLRSAVVSAADAAAAKEVAFSVSCDDDLVAYANPQAVAAIVGNLASNACKYTAEGGTVTVRATVVDDEVCVDVIDTGVGIAEAHQERVFERFYRIDEGRARSVGGTGIGLAIVKHLTEATGARVSLRSEEGKGSTFTLHLPRGPEEKEGPTWDVTLRGGSSSDRSGT